MSELAPTSWNTSKVDSPEGLQIFRVLSPESFQWLDFDTAIGVVFEFNEMEDMGGPSSSDAFTLNALETTLSNLMGHIGVMPVVRTEPDSQMFICYVHKQNVMSFEEKLTQLCVDYTSLSWSIEYDPTHTFYAKHREMSDSPWWSRFLKRKKA